MAFDQDGHGRSRQVGQHIHRDGGNQVATPYQERCGQCQHQRSVAQRPVNQSINHHSLLMGVPVRGDLGGEGGQPNQVSAACDHTLSRRNSLQDMDVTAFPVAQPHGTTLE